MKKVMTVAMMLLVSLSLALLVSCPDGGSATNSKARMYLLDTAKDELDVVVNKESSFKVVIELENDHFNTANVKENQSVKDWFKLTDFGNDEKYEFTAKVHSLESTDKSTASTGRKYNKLIVNFNLKTFVSSAAGKINVEIPRTGLVRNAYTKSNKDIAVEGTIKVNSSYKERVSLAVLPSPVVLKADAKALSVKVSIKNGTFAALNKGNIEDLRNAVSVSGSASLTNNFVINDLVVEPVAGSQTSFILTMNTKKAGNLPTIAKTSVTVKVAKSAMQPNAGIESLTGDLTATFVFECNGGGTPTPGPEPKPDPTPTPSVENKASVKLAKSLTDLSEDTDGILGKVNEGVSKYIKIELGENSGTFNSKVLNVGRDVTAWFALQDFDTSGAKVTVSRHITSTKDSKEVITGLVLNYRFIPRTATTNPVSLKVSIPVYDNESNEQIRTGITEKLVLTCDIKVGIEKNSNPDPKPTPIDPEPITPGDESEVAIRLINGYTIDSRGNVKIDYSNTKMPILYSGVYNDVFFALELKNGNYFNSPSLELTERGNVTEWFSDIPTVKYDYSAYISACPDTRRDKDSKVLILCLHILPKELAKDGEMLTPSITVKPKDTKNSNPYVRQFYTILKGEDDYVKEPIVVQDKLHMQVKRDNYAGVYFENNHNWSTSCGNNPGAWRLKLVNLKLKDPKIDISKFATIKGFAPNGQNSQADEKLEQLTKSI